MLRQMRAGGSSRVFWRQVDTELRDFFARRFDSAATDELVQRTTMVVWRKLESYEQTAPDSFVRWLRVIAANEARDHRREAPRAAARRAKLRARPSPSKATSPFTWLRRHERLEFVKRIVAALPSGQRDALQFEDARALAEARGLDIDAARMRRHRALQRLVEQARASSTSLRVRVVTRS